MKRSILVASFVLALVSVTQAQDVSLPFREDFNGSMSSLWHITNPNASRYSLSENPVYLRLYSTPTDIWGGSNNIINLFTVPISSADAESFSSTIKVTFPSPPYLHPQHIGIVFFGDSGGHPDMDNFVRAVYGFIDGFRRLQRAYEVNGDNDGKVIWGPSLDTGTDPLWIRITKTNSDYQVEYSLNGTDFVVFDSFLASLSVRHVGIYAGGNPYSDPVFPADFDYFEISPASPAQYVPFSVTFNWSDSFSIYGYQPVPQNDGFDYYFTPLALDTSLIGRKVTISNIDVSATGTSIGSVINWDWEVHLGPSPFGFPEGQFVETHIDPVAGYTRTAPTQLQFVVGSPYSTHSTYAFSGSYDFLTSSMTASPQLLALKNAATSEMNLTNGLYAQLFFWTADNRDCHIQFEDATLTVSGKVKIPLPKEVSIDIKPGTSPNCFNQNERGVIPVAILGASDLNAEDIIADSLSLQGLAVRVSGKSDKYLAHLGYVNDDEFIDLIVQFDDTDDWVSAGDGYATLKGYLTSGISIEGKDAICIVP